MCDKSIDAQLTSPSGETGARDQSPDGVTGQQSFTNSQIFAGKETCAMKNWIKAVESDLNQVK